MIDSVIPFIVECEKLKAVERRTQPAGLDRRENSAEHSWSLALLAMALAADTDPGVDQLRVIKMLVIHDIVEIDAGDTFCYADRPDEAAAEELAAARIFALLPCEVAAEFTGLWREFALGETGEARVARALDRLLPLVQNHHNGGGSWREHEVTLDQTLERNACIGRASGKWWTFAKALLNDAANEGMLATHSPPPGT